MKLDKVSITRFSSDVVDWMSKIGYENMATATLKGLRGFATVPWLGGDCANSWQTLSSALSLPNKTRCRFVCFEWSFVPLLQRKAQAGGLTYTSLTCSIRRLGFRKKKVTTRESYSTLVLWRFPGLGLGGHPTPHSGEWICFSRPSFAKHDPSLRIRFGGGQMA